MDRSRFLYESQSLKSTFGWYLEVASIPKSWQSMERDASCMMLAHAIDELGQFIVSVEKSNVARTDGDLKCKQNESKDEICINRTTTRVTNSDKIERNDKNKNQTVHNYGAICLCIIDILSRVSV